MSGWMRSPGDDEDRTPPELRPGSNCGGSSRRSSSGRTRHIPGNLPGHGVSNYSEVSNKHEVFLIFVEKIFPATWLHGLLAPPSLLISEKSIPNTVFDCKIHTIEKMGINYGTIGSTECENMPYLLDISSKVY